MPRILALFLLSTGIFIVPNSLSSQVLISDGGTAEACSDYFLDDGTLINPEDPNGAPYSDQNYNITICPSTPGDAVQVEFLAFDLQTNPNPNNNDVLIVHDGDDVNAPVVGVGSGNLFEGISITGSVDNPTGCLTFEFVVLNGATGGDIGWVASISCVTPCTYPESGYELVDPEPFDDFEASVGVCPGQDVTFDGSTSVADGEPLEYWIWNWGDGQVDSTLTEVASHAYDEPGEYLVSLVVADENSCTSVNLDVYQVLVSTIPIFNADFSSPLCTGSPGFLDGNPGAEHYVDGAPSIGCI